MQLDDYISNYYVNSTLIKRENLNAMLNFDNCCSEVILYFVDILFEKTEDSRYNFTYTQILRKNKTKLNFFKSLFNWLYNKYLEDIKIKNLEISFPTYIKENKENEVLMNKFYFMRKTLLYVNNDTLKELIVDNSLSQIPNISEEKKSEIVKILI